MASLDKDRIYAELRARTAALAEIVTADPASPVPTCPEWTFRNLATHVGRGHLWAAQMVADRAAEFLPYNQVRNGKLPEDPQQQREWLAESAEQVVAAVSAAGEDPVWTFIGARPASFWGRRRMHEVAVHLADAQLAAGLDVDIPADLAADGVAEWLEMVAARPAAAEGALAGAAEETLHFHATDEGLDGSGEWLAKRADGGVKVEAGHAKADVAVRGPAAKLLLVLTRRLPAGDPAIEIFGDAALFSRWLASTPF